MRVFLGSLVGGCMLGVNPFVALLDFGGGGSADGGQDVTRKRLGQ